MVTRPVVRLAATTNLVRAAAQPRGHAAELIHRYPTRLPLVAFHHCGSAPGISERSAFKLGFSKPPTISQRGEFFPEFRRKRLSQVTQVFSSVTAGDPLTEPPITMEVAKQSALDRSLGSGEQWPIHQSLPAQAKTRFHQASAPATTPEQRHAAKRQAGSVVRCAVEVAPQQQRLARW